MRHKTSDQQELTARVEAAIEVACVANPAWLVSRREIGGDLIYSCDHSSLTLHFFGRAAMGSSEFVDEGSSLWPAAIGEAGYIEIKRGDGTRLGWNVVLWPTESGRCWSLVETTYKARGPFATEMRVLFDNLQAMSTGIPSDYVVRVSSLDNDEISGIVATFLAMVARDT